jgi:SAM-dependent methyltransferase
LLVLNGETSLAVFVTSAERVGLHKGRRVVAQVVEYLRRRRLPFGLLTNGREWRFIFADADNLAWVEWAADRWLEGDALTDEVTDRQVARLVQMLELTSPMRILDLGCGTAAASAAPSVTRTRSSARLRSGTKITLSSVIELTTFTAFDEVQHISLSALTLAVVLM